MLNRAIATVDTPPAAAACPLRPESGHEADRVGMSARCHSEAKLSDHPRDAGMLCSQRIEGGIIMKRPSRRSLCLAAAGALSIVLGLTGASSQTARTVKIVVPYPAGGTADILARILGEQISRTEGVTLLTENRPGASAVIGTEAVSRAAPDGSTLLITSTAFLIAPHLQKLSYDPLTSFEPICQLVSAPIIIV